MTGDGSELYPFASINRAVEAAQSAETVVEILVGSGTYDVTNAPVVLRDAKLRVLGGYNSGHWAQRAPDLFPTVIKGGRSMYGQGAVSDESSTSVVIHASATSAVFDGFVIVAGDTTTFPNTECPGEICDLPGDLHCRVTYCCQGTACLGSTCIHASGSPTLSNNVCFADQEGNGRTGLRLHGSGSPLIVDNVFILAGEGTDMGIFAADGISGRIVRNYVRVDDPAGNAWAHFGVRLENPAGTVIDSNVIDMGTAIADGASGNVAGVGISGSGSVVITNNTIRAGAGYQQTAAIGDFDDPANANVTYTVVNNILWGVPNTSGGKTYCLRLQGTSTFSTAEHAGLDNNAMFRCSDGLVAFHDDVATLSDVGAVNASPDFSASANVDLDLLAIDAFSDPASGNWRVRPSWYAPSLSLVTRGGLVRSMSRSPDADGMPRPFGIVGDTGWSMGAYQQSD